MSHPSHSLHRLWTAASLTSGWPVLCAEVPSEEEAAELTEALEGLLGRCPQAVWYGPDRSEEAWSLRCALPGLSVQDALLLQDSLSVRFMPGPRPAVAWARELGLRCDSQTWDDGVCFVRPQTDAADVPPEWIDGGQADATVQALEVELSEAIRSVQASLASTSDRGVDTGRLVREVVTGRMGLVWSFGSLGGEWVPEVLAAVAAVVRGRAEHETLRLAPDVWWWSPLDGLDVLTWLVVPAVGSEPSELPEGDTGWLHVVPSSSHEEAALAVARWAEGEQAELEPLEPQWLRLGEEWVFCPTWRGARGAEIARLDEVASVHAIPWTEALDGAGPAVSVQAWSSEHGWAVCLRHAERDRDWMPPAEARAPVPDDAAALACFTSTRHIAAPRPVQTLTGPALDLVLACHPMEVAATPVPVGWSPVRWVVRRPGHCVVRIHQLATVA